MAAALPILRRDRGPIARLVSLAPASARVVEARLTGGFAWAPYRGANRGGDTTDAARLRLAGAAGDLVDRADHDGSVESRHAAGVALLLVQEPVDAITRLEAQAHDSKDAKVWSDLAAARLAASSQLGRASLLPTALAAADKALQIQPGLPEGLFNRALILEHLGLLADAKSAWQAYLLNDPQSEWAEEARSRARQLPPSMRVSQFDHDRPLLEEAIGRGDTAAVRQYVERHRERIRSYADAEYLGRWGEAIQHNDAAAEAHWLSLARGVGDTVFAMSREALERDAVHLIDSAPPADRHTIAAAHVLYRSGYNEYKQGQRAAAERDLTASTTAFEAAHDPMALQSRFFTAAARSAGSDASAARSDLEGVLSVADTHPEYLALRAAIRWELGRVLSSNDEWSQAASAFSDGAKLFRRAGERTNEGFIETMLAFALTSLGRNDDAWQARVRAFSALSVQGDPGRLATSVAVAAYAELAADHRDAALALTETEAAIARDPAKPELAIKGLVTRALIQSMNGDASAATQTARQASALAQNVADPALRATWNASVAAALGAAIAEQNPSAALEPLTEAVDFYAAHQMPGALLDPLLLRARCTARVGNVQAAMDDLERGMSIVESHPAVMQGEGAGWGLFDAEHALFGDAIRIALDRGDKAAAFALAERSHGTPTTIPELQHRIAGTGTAVVEIVAIRDELVTFAVTENDAVVARRPVSIEMLASLAEECISESGTTAAAKLYEVLIRPVDRVLAGARQVVVVPDYRLTTVPYGALYDTVHSRFLVELAAISTAPSAGALRLDDARGAAPVLAAIALPSGRGGAAGLPDADDEIREVTQLYARAIPMPPQTFAQFRSAAADADVIHISGHTERQPGGGEQALLFAGASGQPERISWKTIVATPATKPAIVVLAACETLRPPPSTATHALSLGAAFSASGASDVIGTLLPIADRDARVLFDAIHRGLASGLRPAEAVRAAQREAINLEKTSRDRRSWRAVAVLTRRFPAGNRKE
jgi:hypothetical protein